jgi:hypothetical protein
MKNVENSIVLMSRGRTTPMLRGLQSPHISKYSSNVLKNILIIMLKSNFYPPNFYFFLIRPPTSKILSPPLHISMLIESDSTEESTNGTFHLE